MAITLKRIQKQVTLGPLSEKSISITCPRGYLLTGGGFAIGSIGKVTCSFPVSLTEWRVTGSNPYQGGAIVLQAFAMCIKV
jgi:hypothetical protein